ncbi:MAG TPA: hypothetical protein VMS17_28670 [Gemmataceae bacterium]|nr:hypothetical protein [Gemmataceae bacterium]
MEALHEWTRRTTTMRDDEGRPLGESKALEQVRGVPLELRTCPYAGSRHNHTRPMNVSALKQMLAHWDHILGGLELLRSLYCEQAQREAMRLIDVWRIGGLTTSLIDFAFLRAWAPFRDGELPAQAAVLYKAPLGVALTTSAMWADGAKRFDSPVDAEMLYEYADRSGHFIGLKQVCAGPVALVEEVLHKVVDGGGGRGDSSKAAAVMGDSERFLRYAHAAAALSLLRMAHDRLDAGMALQLAQVLADDLAAPAMPEALERKFRIANRLGFDVGARLNVLDELLTHVADPRLVAAGVVPGARAIREAWACPLGEAGAAIERIVAASTRARQLQPQTRAVVGQHLERFLAVNQAIGSLVRFLKSQIADALGVELTAPRARELRLTEYIPAGLRLMEGVLSEALAIEMRGELARPAGPPADAP